MSSMYTHYGGVDWYDNTRLYIAFLSQLKLTQIRWHFYLPFTNFTSCSTPSSQSHLHDELQGDYSMLFIVRKHMTGRYKLYPIKCDLHCNFLRLKTKWNLWKSDQLRTSCIFHRNGFYQYLILNKHRMMQGPPPTRQSIQKVPMPRLPI